MEKKNIEREEIMKKGTKVFSEFKQFISKGNVVDLAVGVIIGGIDFSNLSITVGSAVIGYGKFVQNVIDFCIVIMYNKFIVNLNIVECAIY